MSKNELNQIAKMVAAQLQAQARTAPTPVQASTTGKPLPPKTGRQAKETPADDRTDVTVLAQDSATGSPITAGWHEKWGYSVHVDGKYFAGHQVAKWLMLEKLVPLVCAQLRRQYDLSAYETQAPQTTPQGGEADKPLAA